METKGFFQLESIINILVSCHYSFYIYFSARLFTSEYDVYRRQSLTYTGGPRDEKINPAKIYHTERGETQSSDYEIAMYIHLQQSSRAGCSG